MKDIQEQGMGVDRLSSFNQQHGCVGSMMTLNSPIILGIHKIVYQDFLS